MCAKQRFSILSQQNAKRLMTTDDIIVPLIGTQKENKIK